MKTYEETAQNALERINQYQTEQKNKRKTFIKAAAPVVSLCLAAVLGVGIWQSVGALQSGLFKNDVPPIDAGQAVSGRESDSVEKSVSPVDTGEVTEQDTEDFRTTEEMPCDETSENDPDITEASETAAEKPETVTDEVPEAEVEVDDVETVQGFCHLWWNNRLSMGGPLYFALQDDPDGVFPILATYRPMLQNIDSFTYEGKTLYELGVDADNERVLPEKMAELLKAGDELKYGTALYETGDASGMKWDKSFYEERIAYFGEELLGKYIADGEFYGEKLEKDLAEFDYNANPAGEKYRLAYDAYLETVLPSAVQKLSEFGISCKRPAGRKDALILSATAEELLNLPLETPEYWIFDLIAETAGGTSANAADDTGLFVVN